eukprot:scaffold86862_cov38-Prasinocladus_malaysianus.AAC.1
MKSRAMLRFGSLSRNYRAKHDLKNTAIAGCFTGGALAYGGGPQAMCLGCATLSAFSVMIDRFMERD